MVEYQTEGITGSSSGRSTKTYDSLCKVHPLHFLIASIDLCSALHISNHYLLLVPEDHVIKKWSKPLSQVMIVHYKTSKPHTPHTAINPG